MPLMPGDEDDGLVRCPRCQAGLPRERFLTCPRCLLEDDPEPEVLDERYQLERLVGRGGAGRVYRARDLKTGKTVAVKLLDDDLSGRPELERRFAREARALRLLHHPGIVGFRDFGHDGERTYIVMEFVDGEPLQAQVPLEPEPALRLFRQICDALAYAHARGVVHRDLKPGNILVDAQGRVKVADFGLAAFLDGPEDTRLTRASHAVGTADYMAPEARLGARPDPRQDIYALGVVLYQMLTGRLPLGHFDLPEAPVGPVLARALSPEPDRRQPSVQALRQELAPEQDTLPGEERARAVLVAGTFACGSMLALTTPGRALQSGQLAASLAPIALSAILYATAEILRRSLLRRWRGLGLRASQPSEPWRTQCGVLALAMLALGGLLLQLAPPAAAGRLSLGLCALIEFAALAALWLHVLELQRGDLPVSRDPALAVAAGQLLLGAFLPVLAVLRPLP